MPTHIDVNSGMDVVENLLDRSTDSCIRVTEELLVVLIPFHHVQLVVFKDVRASQYNIIALSHVAWSVNDHVPMLSEVHRETYKTKQSHYVTLQKTPCHVT